MLWLIADAAKESGASELKNDYGSLIFMGVFFIAVLVGFIWWLRR